MMICLKTYKMPGRSKKKTVIRAMPYLGEYIGE